jgi:hypothetical protein
VVIEQVAARPGQGTVSMFKFGFCAGAISRLVVGLQLPYTFVLPKTWQRAVGIGPSSDQARQRAAQLYPQSASQLIRKRDGGRADAILIARHGLRLMHQPRGDCRRMTTAASPPSMLPNPQPASEPVYVVRR